MGRPAAIGREEILQVLAVIRGVDNERIPEGQAVEKLAEEGVDGPADRVAIGVQERLACAPFLLT